MTRAGLVAVMLILGSWAQAGCSLSPYGYCEPEDIPGSSPTGEAPADDEASLATARRVAEILPTEHTAVDLLFVIDDSLSMEDEQEQLGRWSNELFDVLSLSGELPDLHLAVISSSLRVSGVKGCESAADGYFHTGGADLGGERFLRDVADGWGGRSRNYQGSLTETFAQMAKVGANGCGFEQPFAATRRALSGIYKGHDGFLREEALLVVIFVTDEDDCSMTDLSLTEDPYANACSPLGAWTCYRCFEFGVRCRDGKGARQFGERTNCEPDESSAYVASVKSFVTFLQGLKDDPGKIVVAGIYGKPHQIVVEQDPRYSRGTPQLRPACQSSTANALPGIRLNAMLSHFPARAAQSSICEPELSWALRRTGLLTRTVATRSPCLIGSVADTNLEAKGIQPACRVFSITDKGTPAEIRTSIPRCADGQTEGCYRLEVDSEACAETESQLALRVSRSRSVANETLTVECDVARPIER